MAFNARRAEQQLIAIYQRAYISILEAIAHARERGNVTGFQEAMLADVASILQELDGASTAWVEQVVPRLYREGRLTALDTWRKAGRTPPPTQAGFATVHRDAVRLLAENLHDNLQDANNFVGRRVRDMWRRAQLDVIAEKLPAGQTMRQAKRNLQERVAEQGLGAFRDSMGRVWRMDDYASMAVRSVTAEAQNLGSINQLRGMGRDLVKMTEHGSPCELCVTEDTVVSGPLAHLGVRRKYRGDIVRIRTASGNHLSGTPDHTVLTVNGWRRLKELQPGDKVISETSVNVALHEGGVMPDKIQMPTRIKDVCETLSPPIGMHVLARPTGGDFEGNVLDHVAIYGAADSEIDVITSNGGLLAELNSALAKGFGNEFFITGVGSSKFGSGFGNPAERFFGMPAPAPSVVNWFHDLAAFFGGFPLPEMAGTAGGVLPSYLGGGIPYVLHDPDIMGARRDIGASEVVEGSSVADPEGFAKLRQRLASLVTAAELGGLSIGQLAGGLLGALGTSATYQDADPWDADVEFGSQLLRRLSGSVTADDVVSVSVSKFSGHVYDLQTVPSWYVSNEIISHNCAMYEGRVYSISGETEGYPPLSVVPGFADGYSVIHPNCRHRTAPFVPELADNPEAERRKSNEPFTDTRSEAEKRRYENEQKEQRMRREVERLTEAVAVMPDGAEKTAARERLRTLRKERTALRKELGIA